MTDLLLGLGLVLAVEGILFAAFPAFIKRRMHEMLALDEGFMRVAGLITAVAGVALVWAARRLLA
ncbi:MAG: DUF2065 domain-containing protein [Burkholderiales bacterium]|nr:DUF2065 domain-containing protein [Burkholderiales bacterium]